MITVLSVKEMCCPVEGRAVEKALRAMEGVEEILFDYAARTVRVTHGTVAVEALVREVEKLGMTACVSEAAKSEAPAISIRVPEMDCPVEAAQIEKAFAAAGLPKATFDTERRVVRVAASFEAAKAAIESCGYRAELLREPSGRIVFKVPDMDCPVEVAEIQKALKKRGIEGAECDTEARTVTLSGDEATAKTVKEAIESCGYEAERIRTSSGRIVFKVPDMDCPVEVAEIQKALKKCGIEGAECNTESRTVTIAGDEATAEAVKAAIESCGYEATRVEVKRKAAAPEADPIPWGRYITALVIGLLSEAVELWSHYAAESLPVSVETASWASIVFALIAIALAGLATFRSGLTALRHGNLNMNARRAMAVQDPVRLTVVNMQGEEECEVEDNPNAEVKTCHTVNFGRNLYIDRADFAPVPPPKYKRLVPGGTVRLKGAYILQYVSHETDENGNQTQASVDSFETLEDGFFNSNIVYLIRNENYVTTGGNEEEIYNAKIKHIQYKVQQTTQMMGALQNQDVDVADPSATRENMASINATSFLTSVTVRTAGYGYIGINAKFIPNIYIRRALMTVFDPSLVQNYYPGTLSTPIYRPFSTTSWVYDAFEDDDLEAWAPTSYYGYDDSFASARALLIEGGCTFSNGVWSDENGDPIEITLTIAGDTYDHPAYQTFLKASDILNENGIKTTVVPDARALYKLASGGLAVWAAAWSSTVDPDMYQVYHKDSRATSVLNWGYDYLLTQDNATAEEDEIINTLSDLIDEGRETIVQSERARIYREAADEVMKLAVEFPLYQRSDIFVYNSDLIDASTLVQNPTPYMSPFAEIWKVSYRI